MPGLTNRNKQNPKTKGKFNFQEYLSAWNQQKQQAFTVMKTQTCAYLEDAHKSIEDMILQANSEAEKYPDIVRQPETPYNEKIQLNNPRNS